MQRNMARINPVLLFISLCLFTLSGCISDGGDSTEVENYVVVGDELPYFEINEDNGERFRSNSLMGKKAMIVFFDTGCNDCKRELPIIEEAWRVLKNDPECMLVAIARGQTAKDTDAFWTEYKMTMPKYHDPQQVVFKLFANSYVPRLYLCNKKGIVEWMGIEKFNMTATQLVEKVNALDKDV